MCAGWPHPAQLLCLKPSLLVDWTKAYLIAPDCRMAVNSEASPPEDSSLLLPPINLSHLSSETIGNSHMRTYRFVSSSVWFKLMFDSHLSHCFWITIVPESYHLLLNYLCSFVLLSSSGAGGLLFYCFIS